MNSYNIVVCASGGGGNFQAIIDNQKKLGYKITLLITDRICKAIERAEDNNIKHLKVNKEELNILDKFFPQNTDLVVLAGFFPIISKNICEKWNKKIINVHPSLLPKYGGKGMYGVKVQEAVMKNKEKLGGCTVHYVSSEIDLGEIILQKKIKVDYNLTPWEFGGIVHEKENKLLIEVIRKLMNEKT